MPDEESAGTGDPQQPSDATRRQPSAPTSDMESPPRSLRQIGHYHVKRVIGTGGMGTVYEAVQEHPRRTVALKVMRPGIASRSALHRFEYESQILARLRHPNIAQVFEAGTHEEAGGIVPYFVLEYIPNARSITEYAREKGLSSRQRLELFAKVCDAVHHGHRKGIIHRDLKPANIVVDSSGEPKIIDFGVARTTESDLVVTTLQTAVGQLLGTIQYMSPEQVDADPLAIDSRSDVYSLGVVLYELLSDKLPYDVSGAAVLEAARIIKQEPPTRLSTVDTKLRGELETVVLTALEKDSSRRYQTADELRQDILRYLNDEPIVARRPSLAYLLGARSRALVKRHPIATWALIIAVTAVLAELIGVQIVYRWTPAHDGYKHALAAFPWPADAVGAFEDVSVVRITDETAGKVEQIARDEGVAGVDPRNWRSMRRLHGRFMERLAQVGVGSLTWNITFRTDSEFDGDFARGVEALRAMGADVVVGVKAWPLGADERPAVSEIIYGSRVSWGGTTVNFDGSAPWNLHLFLQRGVADPQQSLVLAAAAAHLRSGYDVDYAVDSDEGQLTLRYYEFQDPQRLQERRVRHTAEVSLSTVVSYTGDPGDEGRQSGDLVGIYIVEMPDDAALETATVDYEWIFEADVAQLRDRLAGKAVVVGDLRTGRAPVFPHPDGRTLSATYGYAAGLEALLRGGVIRAEGLVAGTLASIVAAIAGIAIAAVSTGRVGLRYLLIIGVAGIAFFASILSYHGLAYLLDPLVPLLAMIVACELAVGVNRARQTRLA
ncbi:MAG: serine/threonine protein kinase [Planctomycetota bacterium]|jgi:hypothetical protein